MSSLPLRSCSEVGCANLVECGKCASHKRVIWRLLARQSGTSTERGYDAKHRKMRVSCFVRDEWKCVDCGWKPDILSDFHRFGLGEPPVERILAELSQNFRARKIHLVADHIIPIQVRPDLRLELSNLQTLCDKCHNRKTLEEVKRGEIGFKPVDRDKADSFPRVR